jgi:hypothetical protein
MSRQRAGEARSLAIATRWPQRESRRGLCGWPDARAGKGGGGGRPAAGETAAARGGAAAEAARGGGARGGGGACLGEREGEVAGEGGGVERGVGGEHGADEEVSAELDPPHVPQPQPPLLLEQRVQVHLQHRPLRERRCCQGRRGRGRRAAG